MAAIHFKETQRFRETWIFYLVIAIVLVVSVFVCMGIFRSDYAGITKGIYCLLIPLLSAPVAFLYFIKLELEVDDMGIHYKMSPIHGMTKSLFWDQVAHCQIRQYRPIWEYGGWGWRRSFRRGQALTISGTKGLQIVLKNRKQLLIGVRNSEQLNEVLNSIKKKDGN